MTFEAAIFDLDGTLVDSLADIADSMNRVLSAAGLPVHPKDAYRDFIGDGIETLTRRALPEALRSVAQVAAFTAAMKTDYGRHWADKSRPYPRIPELLRACRATGLKIAVLSNKPHGPAVAMVHRLLGTEIFAQVWGASPEIPRKPDPAGALAMARTLGISPERCIYLGDMPVDMETAKAAGMFAAAALWGFRGAEELVAAGARALFRSPDDLRLWLEASPRGTRNSEYPDAPRPAVGAVVFHRQRVLLVRRGKAPASGLWAIPGGSLNLGESLQEAAEREIFEETGIRIQAGDPVFTFEVIQRKEGRVRFHYVIVDLAADYLEGEPKAGDDAREARWVAADELAGLDVNPSTRKLLKERFNFY